MKRILFAVLTVVLAMAPLTATPTITAAASAFDGVPSSTCRTRMGLFAPIKRGPGKK